MSIISDLFSTRGMRDVLIGAGSRYIELGSEAREVVAKGSTNLTQATEKVKTESAKLVKGMKTVESFADTPLFVSYLSKVTGGDVSSIGDLSAKEIADAKSNFETFDKTKLDAESLDKLRVDYSNNYKKIAQGATANNNIPEGSVQFLLQSTPGYENLQQGFKELETAPNVTASDTGRFETLTNTSNIKVKQSDILTYLKNSLEGMNFQGGELKETMQGDYESLINPLTEPAQKASILQKYYQPVYNSKLEVDPLDTTGSSDVIDYSDLFEDDEDPNYRG